MSVFYRTYRPQNFDAVVGQEHILPALIGAVTGQNPAHAYLFTGSRGVGKTSVARILAKALQCQNLNQAEPCGVCAACLAITNGSSLDCIEIDAASNTGVDNVRELIEAVQFRPSVGKFKVYIIDEVHMLSKAAFNALLKTLEEPPAHVVFIFATTDVQKVPETILSRVQRYDFRRLSKPQIIQQLNKVIEKEGLEANAEVFELVSRAADGGLRDALSLLDQLRAADGLNNLVVAESILGRVSESVLRELIDMAAKPSEQVVDWFRQWHERGVDWSNLTRDLLLLLETDVATGLSAKKNVSSEIKMMRLFLRAAKELSGGADGYLPLLLAVLESQSPAMGARPSNPVVAANKPVVMASRMAVESGASENAVLQKVESIPQVSNQANIKIEQDEQLIVKNTVGNEFTYDLETMLAKWPEVVNRIEQANRTFGAIVRGMGLVEVSGSVVSLESRFRMHQQQFEQPKNILIVGQACQEVLGQVPKFNIRLATQPVVDSGSVLENALEMFGGEVVPGVVS